MCPLHVHSLGGLAQRDMGRVPGDLPQPRGQGAQAGLQGRTCSAEEVGHHVLSLEPAVEGDQFCLQGTKVFCDVGFLSEAEVLKYFKVTAKQLGLTIGSLQLEDRRETLRGYYVSLAGVPANIVYALRKVRLSWKVNVKHSALRLQPEWQIRQEQGALLFQHFSDQQLEKADAKVRTVNRAKLASFESLAQKGGDIVQVF